MKIKKNLLLPSVSPIQLPMIISYVNMCFKIKHFCLVSSLMNKNGTELKDYEMQFISKSQ